MSADPQPLRTPDDRFRDLPGYPWEPRYTDVEGIRVHHVEDGPGDADPVLLLHGEPTWSYLYRTMIPVLAAAGHRVLAPDLVGFGRSDKPARLTDYSYERHVAWTRAWMVGRGLEGVTLVCQDWGSLIGLRLLAEDPGRFARVVVANGFLPTGDRDPGAAFKLWRFCARWSPWFPAGRIVALGSRTRLRRAVRRAYDAPFPSRAHQAGARAFPRLVPTTPSDPAAPANRRAWEVLASWRRPLLTVFGRGDPIFRGADRVLQRHIPGAAGQPHATLPAGHFIQEDAGEELARRIVEWMAGPEARAT